MSEPMSPQRELSCALSTHSNSSNQNSDNLSTKAIYEGQLSELTLSRPLSRGSIASNLSITTKENIQENKRLVVPSYPSSMLGNMTMSHNKLRKFNNSTSSNNNNTNNVEIHIMGPTPHNKLTTDDIFNDTISVTSTPGYPDTPMAPPMSLREKMKLLNIERNIPTMMDESSNDPIHNLDNNLILHSNDMTTSQSMDNVLKYSNRSHHNHSLHNKWTPYTSNHGSASLDTTVTSNLQPFHLANTVMTSELDSIASTIGDDISYMRNFNKNTSHIISPVESFEEV